MIAFETPNGSFTGLYIHVPFCLKKCAYCDFLSVGLDSFASDREAVFRMNAYADCLRREVALLGEPGQTIDSVFVGGGTPSLLGAEAIARILDAVRARFVLASGAEISIEANPGTIDPDKLQGYLEAGVNRISLGVQSLDDGVLAAVGRVHDAAETAQAFEAIKSAGFSNVNVDLMAGLPGQSERSLLETIGTVLAWGPQHISFYPLILEEGTPLEAAVQAGRAVLPDEDETLAMQRAGITAIESAGRKRYEISNFALPGFECRHNLNYWRCGAYLAAGLGASGAQYVTLPGGQTTLLRTKNPSRFENYAAAIGADVSPAAIEERIGPIGQRFECVMLGLRLTEGVSLSAFEKRFGLPMEDAFPRAFAVHRASGLLRVEGGYAFLSERGLEWQNAVLIDFLSEAEESH